MKQKLNEHITKFLNYYIELPSPEYAILLDGAWGSGKTFFIDIFLKNNENEKFKFIKISLFGMRETAEIDEELFQQLHPLLGHKYVKLATNIAKGAFKLGVNLDWDGDKKSDGSLSIDIKDLSIFSEDKAKNKKDIIFVFDDLERTDIEIAKVLGYINSLIETSKQKVIILASEKKLIERDKKKDYKEFKEKVIGKTFEVKQDFDSSFDSFLDLAKNSKKVLKDNKENIQYAFDLAEYKNLRHIRQSILDFEYLFENVDKKYASHSKFMHDFVKEFFVFSIEVKNGKSISDEYEKHLDHIINKDDNSVKNNDNIFDKYSFLGNTQILQHTLWDNYFSQGTLQKEFLSKSFDKSKYFIDDTKEDWVKLYYFQFLENAEFKVILEIVFDKFINNKYCEQTTLLHIVGIFLFLSKNELIDKSIEDVKELSREIIDKCATSDDWKSSQYKKSIHNGTGLGFFNVESKEFQEMQEYLINKNQEAISLNLPNTAKEIIEILKNRQEDVCSLLSDKLFINANMVSVSQLPVFSHIDTKEFLNVFLKLKHNDIIYVIDIFEERYDFRNYNTGIIADLDFWKEFKILLEAEFKHYKGTIKGYWIDETINKIDNKIIKYIEDKK